MFVKQNNKHCKALNSMSHFAQTHKYINLFYHIRSCFVIIIGSCISKFDNYLEMEICLSMMACYIKLSSECKSQAQQQQHCSRAPQCTTVLVLNDRVVQVFMNLFCVQLEVLLTVVIHYIVAGHHWSSSILFLQSWGQLNCWQRKDDDCLLLLVYHMCLFFVIPPTIINTCFKVQIPIQCLLENLSKQTHLTHE